LVNSNSQSDQFVINYRALMELYLNDPITFSIQVLNITPTPQQEEVIWDIIKSKKVTCKSGRGVGKTFCAAIVVWWFLITRFKPQVYITAASGGQVQGGIWPTLSTTWDNMDPVFKDNFDVLATQIKHKEYPNSWFAATRTARRENPEAMAGAHAKNLLYIIDEASGVEENIFKSVVGSLTEVENYLLMLSNPRRLSGFFYDSHKPSNREIYGQHTLSAIDCDFITRDSIEYWKRMYGEQSNTYRIEVLGEFPNREDDCIISWDYAYASTKKKKTKPEGAIFWGLDCAAGGDKSVLIKRQGNVIFDDIKAWKDKDTMQMVGRVVREYNNTVKAKKPDRIFVDSVALGKGPYDRLRELRLPVYPAVANATALDSKYNFNQRAEWWSECGAWFRDEDVQIPDDPNLLEQLTTVKSKIHSSGRFLVERKDEYKKRNPLIGSPDFADAAVMTFCKSVAVKAEILFV
jgi:hypothetical protein